ncbi:hypothetical protein HELRODRAFT_194306 [Helobdella robusta]|uniref:KAT8 regulatory NSL complex subunit 2 n=1 Tax=Helobdella robusta TaxID=6412 RepID=T1FVW9_HELRO|nr:hypothetical protein HELRODRAFT_194306 [Helobdella robusta]ESN92250.1 hypothetical protein HELRODRAFT_194306 [Helobdella robusta]
MNQSDGFATESSLNTAVVYTFKETCRLYKKKLKRLKHLHLNRLQQIRFDLDLKLGRDKKWQSSMSNNKSTELQHQHVNSGLKLKVKLDSQTSPSFLSINSRKLQEKPGIRRILLKRLLEQNLSGSNNNNNNNINNNDDNKNNNINNIKLSQLTCHYRKGFQCNELCLPLSIYCLKHILNDDKQVLYTKCLGDNTCTTPVLDISVVQACPQHFRDVLISELCQPTELRRPPHNCPQQNRDVPVSGSGSSRHFSDVLISRSSGLIIKEDGEAGTGDIKMEISEENEKVLDADVKEENNYIENT